MEVCLVHKAAVVCNNFLETLSCRKQDTKKVATQQPTKTMLNRLYGKQQHHHHQHQQQQDTWCCGSLSFLPTPPILVTQQPMPDLSLWWTLLDRILPASPLFTLQGAPSSRCDHLWQRAATNTAPTPVA